ncbi:MAG: hypothetical protein U1F65_05850 [Verrucomicrobiota bacterium]
MNSIVEKWASRLVQFTVWVVGVLVFCLVWLLIGALAVNGWRWVKGVRWLNSQPPAVVCDGAAPTPAEIISRSGWMKLPDWHIVIWETNFPRTFAVEDKVNPDGSIVFRLGSEIGGAK